VYVTLTHTHSDGSHPWTISVPGVCVHKILQNMKLIDRLSLHSLIIESVITHVSDKLVPKTEFTGF